MLRAIGGVIVGYIVMAVMVGLFFTGLWFVLKKDGSFDAGTYDVTMAWSAGSIVLGLIAAIIGGVVCRKIGGTGGANVALAVLVVVLGGLLFGIQTMAAAEDDVDTIEEAKEVLGDIASGEVVDEAIAHAKFAAGEMSAIEEMGHAMNNAEEPIWVTIGNILVGAVGVLLGGKLVGGGGKTD